MTGVLSHAPILEYDVAKALLSLGLLRSDDILALPRYAPDAGWEATRQQELLKRAHGGRSDAARVLQVPIPTRAQDLADMAKLSEKEEAHMQAYEDYRAADIQRRLGMKERYKAEEELRKDERLRWYEQQAGQIRTRALIKRLGMSEEKALKLLAKGDPRPAWRNRLQNTLEKNRLRNEEMRGILAELAAEKAAQLEEERRTGESTDPAAVEDLEEGGAPAGEEGAVQASDDADAEATDALTVEGEESSALKAVVAQHRKLGAQEYLAEIGATPESDSLKAVDEQLAMEEREAVWASMEAAVLGRTEGELDELVERWAQVQTKINPKLPENWGHKKTLEEEIIERNPRVRREAAVLAQEAMEAEEAEEEEQTRYQYIASMTEEERAVVNKRETDRVHAHAVLLDEDATPAARKRAEQTLLELDAYDKQEAAEAVEEAENDTVDEAVLAAEKEASLIASVPSMPPKLFESTLAQLDRKIVMSQMVADTYEVRSHNAADAQAEADGIEEGYPLMTREQEYVFDQLQHRVERLKHLRSVIQSTRDGAPVSQSMSEFDEARATLLEDRMLQAEEDIAVAAEAFDAATNPAEKRAAAILLDQAQDNVPYDPALEAQLRAAQQEEEEARAAEQQLAEEEEEEEGEQQEEEEEEAPKVQEKPQQQQKNKKPQRSPRK